MKDNDTTEKVVEIDIGTTSGRGADEKIEIHSVI